MTNTRRCLAAVVAAGSFASFSWVLFPASASAGSSFDAFASAIGFQGTLYNPSLPLGVTYELDVPFASAHLTSLQQSDAVASSIYPGETVAGAFGLAGAIVNFPTPAYPVEVRTGFGDRPRDLSYPGLSSHAESSATQTYSKAQFGTDAQGATSSARVEESPDGSVAATADSSADGLLLGQVVRIRGFSSQARTVADGNSGELTRSTSLQISQLSVPALAIPLPATSPTNIPLLVPVSGVQQPAPLVLPPIPIPLGGTTLANPDIGFANGAFFLSLPGLEPTKFAIPAQSVFDAFKAAGVTMTYQPAKVTNNGVVGDAFTFSFEVPAPPKNDNFNGTTPVTYTMGGAVTSVDLQATPGVSTGSSDGVPAAAGVGTVVPGDGVTDSISAGTLPAIDLGPGAVGTTPGTDPAASITDLAAANGNTDAAAQLAAFTQSDDALTGIYLALVATAVVAFAAVSVLRVLGVRFLWNS